MSYIEPEFRGILLNTTDACNLECRYCFVQQHPHYMTYQIAKDATDMLIQINNKRKNKITPSISFFGGEPTLMWDSIIVPLTKYIREELKEPFQLNMTSNCILLDEEKMDFMNKNQIGLLFSIDGNKETQDYNRPCHDKNKSSFDILAPKIKTIVKHFPHTTFRSTLIPATCHNLFDNILFAQISGFKNCFACPNDFEEWNEQSIETLKTELRKYSLYYIDCFRRNVNFISFSPLESSFAFVFKHNKLCNTRDKITKSPMRCGMGTTFASVNYEGKLFGCQQMPSYGYDNNIFYLGDIYNGIDEERAKSFQNEYINNKTICHNPDQCKNCYLYETCQNSYCHSNSFLLYGNLYEKAEIRCIWDKMLLDEAIFIMTILGKNNNEKFLNKIKQIIKENKL